MLRSRNTSQGPVAEKHPMFFHSHGFTLIELLVVISIISLLSSVVFTSVNSARAKARNAKRRADMNTLYTAVQLYFDTIGVYPPVVDDRGDGWDNGYDGTFMQNLVPSYLPAMLIDPAGIGDSSRSYYYRADNNYGSPPFCPAGTQAIIHFYLDAPDANTYTLCSVQATRGYTTYGHCICLR